MTPTEFFQVLRNAEQIMQVETALEQFESANAEYLKWVPVGDRENNKGPIEIATDPGRCIIERVTNGIDAVLEAEYERHHGTPRCQSPKEAAITWLNVPDNGLSGLKQAPRRALAQRVVVTVLPGEDRKESRTVEIADNGVGLKPEEMSKTILSLNESNKIQKHHLAGVYGQGGSSTFAISKYTLIVSKHREGNVCFTVVRYNDLPPEEYKVGNYVYLTLHGNVLQAEVKKDAFPAGTVARHFGYDLTKYPSPLGPNSLYGLLNQVLFDPIIPIFLDNQTLPTRQRRTIVGSRNRLNGAADDEDESRRGPTVDHNMSQFYIPVGEFGNIGIEYWVIQPPNKENKRPSATYVNPNKPIILTHNGQNHAEITQALIKKDCELPFLSQRLICHISCDNLTPAAKRALFASTREEVKAGVVFELIKEEIIRVLRTDDELKRLNNEARERNREEQDESAVQQMRTEVAKILRIHGLDISQQVGGAVTTSPTGETRPTHPRNKPSKPQPIELHEPPTYIKIVWEEDKEISFYPEQRRYIRIETDANSNYHDPSESKISRINIISTNSNVVQKGSTALRGGRMRAVFECGSTADLGETGVIRVELSRRGLPVLSDERTFRVVEKPPIKESRRQITLPPFDVRPVEGPDDQLWTDLVWPDNPNTVASSAQMEDGRLVIYYSTIFPGYRNRLIQLERRDSGLANSFTSRYKVWLAVHSLLYYQDQQESETAQELGEGVEEDDEIKEIRERQERCRIAVITSIYAQREIQISALSEAVDE